MTGAQRGDSAQDGTPVAFSAQPPHYDELHDRPCPGTTSWEVGDVTGACDTCGGRTGWLAPGLTAQRGDGMRSLPTAAFHEVCADAVVAYQVGMVGPRMVSGLPEYDTMRPREREFWQRTVREIIEGAFIPPPNRSKEQLAAWDCVVDTVLRRFDQEADR